MQRTIIGLALVIVSGATGAAYGRGDPLKLFPQTGGALQPTAASPTQHFKVAKDPISQFRSLCDEMDKIDPDAPGALADLLPIARKMNEIEAEPLRMYFLADKASIREKSCVAIANGTLQLAGP